jgi:hypothetical protein
MVFVKKIPLLEAGNRLLKQKINIFCKKNPLLRVGKGLLEVGERVLKDVFKDVFKDVL